MQDKVQRGLCSEQSASAYRGRLRRWLCHQLEEPLYRLTPKRAAALYEHLVVTPTHKTYRPPTAAPQRFTLKLAQALFKPHCDSRSGAEPGTCGCGSEYVGCAGQDPPAELAAERSLLVRDPEIIDDPAFSLYSVLTKLAPAGQVDAFTASMLWQIKSGQRLSNDSTAMPRPGFGQLYAQLDVAQPLLAQRFSALMATTALINRLDLATSQNCGEARLSFAMTTAYKNGNQRMTMIVELKVPDDGNGCKTVAQTVDPLQVGKRELLGWLNVNAAGLLAGTAIIPQKFLAAASSEDGARLLLASEVTDPTMLAVEKSLNALSCAGCHLTETKSPFVHIGERLAQKVGGTYRPSGRAVIDDFLQQELIKRKTLLTRVLAGAHALSAQEWRPAIQARVH